MKRLPLIVVFVLLVAVLIILTLMSRRPPTVTVTFDNGVTVEAELADEPSEQERGLADHPMLDDAEGMLFTWQAAEPRTFWMKGVDFAIDIIWIANGKVIGYQLNTQPQPDGDLYLTYSSPGAADMVLEVAAGWVKRQGIEVGSQLTISQ